MEFKFRAIDNRTPSYRSSPSPSPSPFPPTSLSYSSDQASRFNYTMDPMHDPRVFYGIQRDIEKERIRHELIMERLLLEAEVRRELMMERELVKAREIMSLSPWNRAMGFGHDALPRTLPQLSSDVAKDKKRSLLEEVNNKRDKLIMLAKPNPNSKKPNEWSCALCQVSATSERDFNEHLQGKKHKSKEAGLIRARWVYKLPTSSESKNSGKQNMLTESRGSADREMKTEVEKGSVEANKTVVGLDLKMEYNNKQVSGNKNEELRKKNNENANTHEKKNDVLLTGEKTKSQLLLPNGKNFKFWCEDCRVGAESAVVMESHKRGKKHMARRINESKPNQIGPVLKMES